MTELLQEMGAERRVGEGMLTYWWREYECQEIAGKFLRRLKIEVACDLAAPLLAVRSEH